MSQNKLQNLVDELSSLTVLDMSKLKTLLEDKWGVKAAAAAPMMMAAPAAAGAAPAAAEAAGCTIDQTLLEGHIGIIFADEDLFQTTKTVFKFKSENEEVLEVIGGRFEGQLYSAKDVEALSKLPSKPEMQAQLLGTLEAVHSTLLAVIDALLTSVGFCLDNKSNTKEEV